MSRPVRLAGTLGACTAAALVALAVPASAHVTVQPSTATAGGYATLSFKVPNERDDTSTTGLRVQLPTEAPVASVSVQPKPGWTYQVSRGAPTVPLTAHGVEVTEVVTEISWTADPGNPASPQASSTSSRSRPAAALTGAPGRRPVPTCGRRAATGPGA